MPEYLARRRFPRSWIQLPLLHTTGMPARAGVGVGWTRNLSEGGACMELGESLEPKAPLRMRLQTDRGPIAMGAQVVWAGDPLHRDAGIPHGVTFTHLAPEERQALRTLVHRRGERGHAEVRLPFQVSVICRRKGEQAEPPLKGETGDVSHDGLLLLLPEVLPSGTVLTMTLETPATPLKVEGEIVWVESPGGQLLGPPYRHGVRFTTVGWATLLSLGHLLAKWK